MVRPLGLYVATWDMDNGLGLASEEMAHAAPGRLVQARADGADRARATFRAGPRSFDRDRVDEQKDFVIATWTR